MTETQRWRFSIAAERPRGAGGKLALAAPQPAGGRILEIAGLPTIVEIQPTRRMPPRATRS